MRQSDFGGSKVRWRGFPGGAQPVVALLAEAIRPAGVGALGDRGGDVNVERPAANGKRFGGAGESLAGRSSVARLFAWSMSIWIVWIGVASVAHAERAPREGPQDPRIRTIVYSPRDVVRVDGTYGYHTVVELGPDERIDGLFIGDKLAWEATQTAAGNRIVLKPLEDNATTNLTVVTDRRTYSFALRASRSRGKKQMTWRLRFEYPEEEAARRQREIQRAELRRASLVNPEAPRNPGTWNFDYSYAGSKQFVPVQLFDDGLFTYFKFDEREDLPAIFTVDEDGHEALVNSRVSGEYLVVHQVAKRFRLRNRNARTCIFNEAYPRAGRPRLNAPRERSAVIQETRTDARSPVGSHWSGLGPSGTEAAIAGAPGSGPWGSGDPATSVDTEPSSGAPEETRAPEEAHGQRSAGAD